MGMDSDELALIRSKVEGWRVHRHTSNLATDMHNALRWLLSYVDQLQGELHHRARSAQVGLGLPEDRAAPPDRCVLKWGHEGACQYVKSAPYSLWSRLTEAERRISQDATVLAAVLERVAQLESLRAIFENQLRGGGNRLDALEQDVRAWQDWRGPHVEKILSLDQRVSGVEKLAHERSQRMLAVEMRAEKQRQEIERIVKLGSQVETGIKGLSEQMLSLIAERDRIHVTANSLAETDAAVARLTERSNSQGEVIGKLVNDVARLLGGTEPLSDEIAQLMKFYQVGTIEALLPVMARHIERLQEQIRAIPDAQPGYTPRAG